MAVPDEDEVALQPSSDLSEPEQEAETREQLEADLQDTQKQAYAPGTVKNFLCMWKSFMRFSLKYNIRQRPVSVHILCLFTRFLAYSFKSVRAVQTYVFGICTLHILSRVEAPDLKDIE